MLPQHVAICVHKIPGQVRFARVLLDAIVSSKATTVALVVGIVGALIMGLGMSLAMSDLSEIIGIHQDVGMLLGIA